MEPSQNCIEFLKKHEGIVLEPYLDSAKVPTIGIGTTHYPNGGHVSMTDPHISLEQAEYYLLNDLKSATWAVRTYVTSDINQNQFDALVSFAYNVGNEGLHGSTLLKCVNSNPNDPSIRDWFMVWDKVHVDGVLKEDNGLKHRRNDEANLYFS